MDECVGLLLLSRILLSAQRVFVLSPCSPVVEKHTTLIRLLFVGSTITGITLHSDTPAEHQLLLRLQFRRVVDATDSLRRLQTDHIDLYQIHWPERYVPMFGAWQYDVTQQRECTPILEQIEALAAAMRAGKIRAYGLSNETCFGVCEFVRLARENGLPPPASIQNGYSLLMRTFDGDLAEASQQLDVPLLAYSPLAMGLLTGKYTAADGTIGAFGHTPRPGLADARLVRFPQFGDRYKRPRALEAAAQYDAVARKHGLTPLQLALAFVKQRSFVGSTIIGATSLAQLEEQVRAFDVELSPQVLADIEAVHTVWNSPAGQ
jgi:aryl-alcohol dehydrogenase-like predicted oxidoreductase